MSRVAVPNHLAQESLTSHHIILVYGNCVAACCAWTLFAESLHIHCSAKKLQVPLSLSLISRELQHALDIKHMQLRVQLRATLQVSHASRCFAEQEWTELGFPREEVLLIAK